MSFCALMFGAGAGVSIPGISLSISPEAQTAAGFSASWLFPSCTVTNPHGSHSGIVWSFQNVSVGTWSVASGQGTLTAAAMVSGVPAGEPATADFVCTITISGVPYIISSSHSYFNIT